MTPALLEDLFDLIEKAASDADELEGRLVATTSELQDLRAKAPGSVLSRSLVEKLAQVLKAESFLAPTVSAKEAAAHMLADPDQILEFTLNLLRPLPVEGVAVQPKQASEQSGPGKLVTFEGRQFTDESNWVNALRK